MNTAHIPSDELNLLTKEDIYLLRTESDRSFWRQNEENYEYLSRYREQRALAGIHTYALTPVTPHGLKRSKDGTDTSINFKRTWRNDDYDAPVEIQVYGNKVALIAYGETIMSTIITSPAIAEAMRQILKIMMNFYKKSFKQDQK